LREKQKLQERNYLDKFLQLQGLMNLIIKDNEKPDFDVEINNYRVGIEITEYRFSIKHSSIIRSVLSTMDCIKKDVIQKISEVYDKDVLLNYSLRKPIRTEIRAFDKENIIDFLTNHVNHPDVQKRTHDPFFHLQFKYLIDQSLFIESVRVSRSPSINSILVTENDIYSSGPIPFAQIDDIVQVKNKKMEFLRNQENWLIIVLTQNEFSDGVIDEEVLNYDMSKYNFAKIFLLEMLTEQLHEMKRVTAIRQP